MEQVYVLLEAYFEYDDNIYERLDIPGTEKLIQVFRNKEKAINELCFRTLEFYKSHDLLEYVYNEEDIFDWKIIQTYLKKFEHFKSLNRCNEEYDLEDIIEEVSKQESWLQKKLIFEAFILNPYILKSVELDYAN